MTKTSSNTQPLQRAGLILRRHRKLLALTWFMTVAGSAIYTFASPKLYRPQATIEIRPEAPVLSSGIEDSSTLSNSNLWRNYFRTQKSILSGPGILEETLKKLPPLSDSASKRKMTPWKHSATNSISRKSGPVFSFTSGSSTKIPTVPSRSSIRWSPFTWKRQTGSCEN